jgi:hypothetical protein
MTPPSAPIELIVSSRTINSLELIWAPNPEQDVTGYIVFRSLTMNGTFKSVSTELITETQFIDTNLVENTIYYYKLKAVDDAELASEFSEVVSGKTKLGQYPPVLNNSIADFEITEDGYDDTSINLYYWFKDVNHDKLTFRCEGEVHINVTIYQNNGTVLLVPDKDWNGRERLVFFAADENDEVSDEVQVTVTAINDPPDKPKIINPMDGVKLLENGTIDFEGACTDPDVPYGDTLTYKWISDISGPLGTGETLKDVLLQVGEHTITLEVSDSEGETAQTAIVVIVQEQLKVDDDADGLPDAWEVEYDLDPTDPTDVDKDPDGDGLSNFEEYLNNTDPQTVDTDKDGLSDFDEIKLYHTNPNDRDTDNDGHIDGKDAYPLDSSKWEKSAGTGAKDNNWVIIAGVIVIVVIIIILLFLFVIKPKIGKKGKPEETYEEKSKMQLTPVRPKPEPTPTPRDIKSLAIKGSLAYSQGRYADAIIAWQEILVREPGLHPDIEVSIKDAMSRLNNNER